MNQCHCAHWLQIDHRFLKLVGDLFHQYMAEETELQGIEMRQYCGKKLLSQHHQNLLFPEDPLLEHFHETLNCQNTIDSPRMRLQESTSMTLHHKQLSYQAVPLFNLPMVIGVITNTSVSEYRQRQLARKAVVDICENYIADLLENPIMKPGKNANNIEAVQEKWEPLSYLVSEENLRTFGNNSQRNKTPTPTKTISAKISLPSAPAPKKILTAQFKAEVALAALTQNKALETLAAQYNVSPQDVTAWKTRLQKGAAELFEKNSTS